VGFPGEIIPEPIPHGFFPVGFGGLAEHDAIRLVSRNDDGVRRQNQQFLVRFGKRSFLALPDDIDGFLPGNLLEAGFDLRPSPQPFKAQLLRRSRRQDSDPLVRQKLPEQLQTPRRPRTENNVERREFHGETIKPEMIIANTGIDFSFGGGELGKK